VEDKEQKNGLAKMGRSV